MKKFPEQRNGEFTSASYLPRRSERLAEWEAQQRQIDIRQMVLAFSVVTVVIVIWALVQVGRAVI